MTHTVITLRARLCGTPPCPGEFMASPTGRMIYRIDDVTTLRQAGERPGMHRYRLMCTRLGKVAPEGVEVRPWIPGTPPGRLGLPAAPVARQPLIGSYGRGETGDFGPGMRRNVVRDYRGRLLRGPDVEVEDQAVDPRNPNRRVRRARRVDTIDLLRRAGTIGAREVEAAGDLRQCLERVAPSVGGGGLTRVGIAPHLCQPIVDTHLKAARKIREASAALGERLWHPVLWVCLGGSVRGYAAQWRIRTHRATALVGDGLTRLGDHFYGQNLGG